VTQGHSERRSDGGLCAIVDDITPIPQFLQDGVRLFGKIDLESDLIDNLISVLWSVQHSSQDRNDSDEIDKRLAVLAVIYDTRLTLLISNDALVQVLHRLGSDKPPFFAPFHIPTRGLEEPAVLAEDLMLRIARELTERRRGVNDRSIVSPYINNDE
jgi:hypothetical protein